MSAVKMLTPSQGAGGLVDFVVNTVNLAGANPCPPLVVGVGFGGALKKVALLAKKRSYAPWAKLTLTLIMPALKKKCWKGSTGPVLGHRVSAAGLRLWQFTCISMPYCYYTGRS